MKKLIALCAIFLMLCTSVSAEEYSRVKAKHILVDTKAQAEKIRDDIKEGGSFEYYAQIYSKCPSGRNGGNLGYFGRGQMVPEFENAAFKAEVGEVTEPVKTQFGWHLIKVEDKIK